MSAKSRMLVVLSAVVAFCLIAAAQFGSLSRSNEPFLVQERPVAAKVPPGGQAEAELTFRLGKGLHINSNKPSSELLVPTTLKLDPPAGVEVMKIVYPEGEDKSFAFAPEEKLNVYEGRFTIRAKLKTQPSAKPGNLKVEGELKYQACTDAVCYPPKKLPVVLPVEVE